jgi:hypothetical protein
MVECDRTFFFFQFVPYPRQQTTTTTKVKRVIDREISHPSSSTTYGQKRE